ncbi:class I adenylate-forming enzyme family protein [Streptomyces sp. NPDC093225]|uniref:class I adenylate-forming enzyme family protein n=1 Tax=Streptomyces sp. NPDC093225 TaxID=3366034 RepID=UPI00380E6DB4
MSAFRRALLGAVAEGGDRPAVVDDLATVSYALLDRWSTALATALPADGRGNTVVLLPNGAPWLAAHLAVLKAGLVGAPLNDALTDTEIARVLDELRPRAVLCSPEREEDLLALAARLGPERPAVHVVGPIPPAVGAGPMPFAPPSERAPGAPCLLMHTSGTTGAPKAVVQTERALHRTTAYWQALHRTRDDMVALPLPMAHAYGHLVTAATLLAGATLVVTPEAFDAGRWTERMVRHGVTVVEAVPTVYGRLLTAGALPVGLRHCLSSGQQAPAELRRAWQERTGVRLWESWGMTELAGPGLGPLPDSCPGSAGAAVPGLEMRLVQADGTLAEPGAEGELHVRGPQVTPGRRTGSGALESLCDEDGWLHTGDLARRDAHGCVTLTGRSKDVILTRGYTVHPGEIEEALRAHPSVAEAAVFGRPDPGRGEVPHALVIVRQDRRVSAEELLAHCRTRLARYKLPHTVDFTDRLPISPTGKLDRKALRAEVRPSATAGPVPAGLPGS